MNIEYKEYHIEQEGTRFNLYKTTIADKDGVLIKKGAKIYNNIGWSMSWEHIIKEIIALEEIKNETTVTLKEFLAEHKKITDEVINATRLDEYEFIKKH